MTAKFLSKIIHTWSYEDIAECITELGLDLNEVTEEQMKDIAAILQNKDCEASLKENTEYAIYCVLKPKEDNGNGN